jgi:hypothetical protein
MVKYFPECNLEVDFCEHFIYGKQSQVRFPSGVTRERGILESIHSDVFGHVSVPSLGGSMYISPSWIIFQENMDILHEK